jgi:uncharacterized protein YqhQ
MGSDATIRAYGGQAVLGGVMMRGSSTWAVAVRKPDGTIVSITGPVPEWGGRWRKVPVMRGVVALIESIRLGA